MVYHVLIVSTYQLSNIAIPPVIDDGPRPFMSRSAAQITFDSRIPVELAARLRDPEVVLREYGYFGKEAFALIASHTFQMELRRSLEETIHGLTFRQRAKLMAGDALENAYSIASDKNVNAGIRMDANKWLVRVADLEPKEVKNDTNNAFVLQINLG